MTRYWVGDSGSWDDTGHWSASSGGAPGASVPTSTDDVIFDANSFSVNGEVVTIPANLGPSECNSLDFSAITKSFTWAWVDSNNARLNVYSDLTLSNLITITPATPSNIPSLNMIATGIGNTFLTTNGCYIRGILFQALGSGTIQLQDDIQVDHFTEGSGGGDTIVFFTNDFNWVGKNLSVNEGTFHMMNTTFDLTDGGLNTSNLAPTAVLDPGTSIVNMTNGYLSFSEPTQALWDVNLLGGNCAIGGNGTLEFNNLQIDPSVNVEWGNSSVYTINNVFDANGSPGNLITFVSNNPGNTYEISAAVSSISYVDVADCIASGAGSPFDDLTGGVDSGNNTNWLLPPPSPLPEIINLDNITFDSASVQGDISALGYWDEFGIVWGDSPFPTIPGGNPFIVLFGILGPFFVNLSNLIPGQTYYLRVYGLKDGIYTYGVTIVFVVPVQNPLTVISTDNLVSKYRFEILNQDGALLADISGYIENRQFSITRNRPEEINFSINLYVLDQLARNLKTTPLDLLKAGINTVRVTRAGQPICAGQITYWEASLADDAVINVKAMGWLNLLSYRVFSGTYLNKDQNFILRDLITQTQALTNGDFGLTLGLQAVGTNLYAEKIFENKLISDIFIEASEEEGGLDFEFTWDKKINLYKPIGVYRQDILFTYPGNTKAINISYDSTQIVNSLLARGKGNALANINTVIEDLPSQTTYKLRTGVQDFPDMDADQLVNSAASEVAFYRNPIILRGVIYDGGNPACPQVGSFRVGDRIRVFVKELDVLSAFNEFFMIDKMNVAIGSNDEETVNLDLSNTLLL